MQGKRLSFYEFTLMRFSEINKYLIDDAMMGYAVPPLETAGTVVLMFLFTGTIASLAAANCWSSSDLSSFGSTSTGLSSSDLASFEGTGIGSSLRAC